MKERVGRGEDVEIKNYHQMEYNFQKIAYNGITTTHNITLTLQLIERISVGANFRKIPRMGNT